MNKTVLQPIRYDDDGVAIYTTDQIDLYGIPSGTFYVIESVVYASNYGDSYVMEPKPVHRYCRLSRFRTTLLQLLGVTGFKTSRSLDMLDVVNDALPYSLSYTPTCMLWEEIRKVLKANKRQIFYNRIPVIAQNLDLATKKVVNRGLFNDIMNDFKKLERAFTTIKFNIDRIYFPSLRFIALKLCEEYNIQLPIDIPYCRTKQKFKSLHETYALLKCQIAEDEFNDVLINIC